MKRTACLLLATAMSASARTYVVTDYGAKAGGTTLNTAAIQQAIDAAAAAGGGTVTIPSGVYRSGSIFLKPGVELHLDRGAVLKGSTDINDFPKRETRIEGHFEPWRMALVNAQQLQHVRITGEGKLDGSGPPYWRAFWQRRRENPKCTNLEVERPRMMFIDRCSDVSIRGIAFEDSGFWNLHLYHCQDVTLEGLRITTPSANASFRAPSTDGIDVDSCQRVTVRGCYISTGDDDIALKGTKGPFAEKDASSPPVTDILVEDVTCGNGNGLVTCGSEATWVRNVTIRNCTIRADLSNPDSSPAVLTLKLRPDTPQHYENILVDGVTLESNVGSIIKCAPWTQFFDLKGQPEPHREVRNVTVRNLHGKFGGFGRLEGNPGDTLADIRFEHCTLELKTPKLRLGPAEHLVFADVTVNGSPYAPVPPQS